MFGLSTAAGTSLLIATYLKEMQFTQTVSDPCMYWKTEKDMMLIGVYIDDIILIARKLKQVKENQSNKFDNKDVGKLKHFLDMHES